MRDLWLYHRRIGYAQITQFHERDTQRLAGKIASSGKVKEEGVEPLREHLI